MHDLSDKQLKNLRELCKPGLAIRPQTVADHFARTCLTYMAMTLDDEIKRRAERSQAPQQQQK